MKVKSFRINKKYLLAKLVWLLCQLMMGISEVARLGSGN